MTLAGGGSKALGGKSGAVLAIAWILAY
jgi:hypothetical protein